MSGLVVYKANSLIEASYRLTINEIRILALTVGVMNPNSNQQVFDFTVAEFVKEFPEIKLENAYKEIQIAINKLYDRSVRTHDRNRITDFRWVSSKTYYKNEGRFRISLTSDVMPYLTQLKGEFTKYQLRNISAFKSVYAIRIYELAHQYLQKGRREISIENLKEWLQVESKYKAFKDLKKRVIDPSIIEINEKSDLVLSYEPVKNGRAVIALDLSIAKRKASKPTPTPSKAEKAEISEKTRKIHGVFYEVQRPKVAKGSDEEGKWAIKNIARVYKDLQELGLMKGRFLRDEDYKNLPTAWLKVLLKYYKISDRYSAKTVANEIFDRGDK